jgi:hypothetical protein
LRPIKTHAETGIACECSRRMREETLYEVGDGLLTLATNAYFQITITFSEETNMGGAYLGQLFSPTEVEKSFNFSQSLGEAFRGLLGSVLGMIQTFKCSAC